MFIKFISKGLTGLEDGVAISTLGKAGIQRALRGRSTFSSPGFCRLTSPNVANVEITKLANDC